MNFLLDVPVLYGSLVRLEPLSVSHGEDLAVAAEEDRGAYGFTRVPHAWEIEEYLIAHFEQTKSGKLVPFAQLRQGDGRAVGCTAYWDPRFWPGRSQLYAIEIGWTWLAASAQRTGINVEAKLQLLEYAFETLGVVRVPLRRSRWRRSSPLPCAPGDWSGSGCCRWCPSQSGWPAHWSCTTRTYCWSRIPSSPVPWDWPSWCLYSRPGR